MKKIFCTLSILSFLFSNAQNGKTPVRSTTGITPAKVTPSTHDGDVIKPTDISRIIALETAVSQMQEQIAVLQTTNNTLNGKLATLTATINTKIGAGNFYTATYNVTTATELLLNGPEYTYVINDAAINNDPKALVTAAVTGDESGFVIPTRTVYSDGKWYVYMGNVISDNYLLVYVKTCPACGDFQSGMTKGYSLPAHVRITVSAVRSK